MPLPELEHRAIPELEDAAHAYADLRDQRMELTQREHALKVQTTSLMKKHGKTVYRHDGIEILLEQPEETVKVRVTREPAVADTDAGGEDEPFDARRAAANDRDDDDEPEVH
jgi:hypothetical protein